MKLRLIVDDKEIFLNDFVNNILGNIIISAVMTLKGVNKNWKSIKIEIENA
ncbi:MAG: hypothetical protein LM593_00565 [Candidatus Verstraetearchaeota archaeon]|jgi:hypothetical protein|nr:hypothetical protein [Candidatus Verstraetearchaeota archaeon]